LTEEVDILYVCYLTHPVVHIFMSLYASIYWKNIELNYLKVQYVGFYRTTLRCWICTAALLSELKPAPLFPVCHYWPNWLVQVCLTSVVTATIIRHTWIKLGQ